MKIVALPPYSWYILHNFRILH